MLARSRPRRASSLLPAAAACAPPARAPRRGLARHMRAYVESEAGGRLSTLRRRAKWYGAVGALGMGVLTVTKVGLSTASFFSSIDFFDVARVSFITGMGTSAALAGLGVGVSRAIRIRPELAFNAVVAEVARSAEVRGLLGGRPQAGAYRAYSWVDEPTKREAEEMEEEAAAAADGTAAEQTPEQEVKTQAKKAVRAARNGLNWFRPAQMQLMFGVRGDGSGGEGDEGMVSAIVEKRMGRVQFLMLTVDVHKTGERVVLAGDGSMQVYQGLMKLR